MLARCKTGEGWDDCKMPQRLLARGSGSKTTHTRTSACTQTHTNRFVFSCRADRQGMGVPYSLEDSSGWPVCCLPAAYTPAIHLLLPGPLTPLPKHTHTHVHTHRLTMVSVCIVVLFGHKSLEVVGAGGEGLQSGPEGFRAPLSIRCSSLLYLG